MRQEELNRLCNWFEEFVQPYLDTDPEGFGNINLKIVHTRKVCEVMALLCAGEGLSPEETRIAQSIALLHDVGRFPQFKRWRTFRDSESDNHARLAIDVIRAENLLAGIEPAERLLIEEAVRFHNLLELPKKYRSPTALFIRLIRDADKLDIWRVFVELQSKPPQERASAANLGFADDPDRVSGTCLKNLADGSIIRLDSVQTVNDFKLLQISWVYDLNFATSRRILLERGHIQALASTLPERIDIKTAVSSAINSLSQLST